MRVFASPKLPVYAVFCALALLAALALNRPEPAFLAVPFVALLLTGLGGAYEPKLAVETRLDRERALEGDEAAAEVLLEADEKVAVEVTLAVPPGVAAFDAGACTVINMSRGGVGAGMQSSQAGGRFRGACTFRLRCNRWGGYVLGDISVRARDLVGLLVYEAQLERRMPLRVYPGAEALRLLLQPLETQPHGGNEVSRHRGDGLEFAEVRDFVPGDRLRQINWRVSARRDKLFVNDRHPERNADVILFLDTFAELTGSQRSSFDLTLRGAASLASAYLSRRDRVGLVSFGGTLRWLTPAMGTRQLYRIIESLLDTQIAFSYVWKGIDAVPAFTLPSKALVVALSPLVDGRAVNALLDLRGRGFDLAVIEISPVPYLDGERGDEISQLAYRLWLLQREALRNRYQRLGVPVATWRPGQPIAAVLEEVRTFRRYARHVSV